MIDLTSKRLSACPSPDLEAITLCSSNAAVFLLPFLLGYLLLLMNPSTNTSKGLSWTSHEKMVVMRIASMVADAAAYVADSALDSHTTFCVFEPA